MQLKIPSLHTYKKIALGRFLRTSIPSKKWSVLSFIFLHPVERIVVKEARDYAAYLFNRLEKKHR